MHPGWRRGSSPAKSAATAVAAQPFGPWPGNWGKVGGIIPPAAPGEYSDHALPSGCSAEASSSSPSSPCWLTSAVAKKEGDTAGAGDWEGAGAQVRPDPGKGEVLVRVLSSLFPGVADKVKKGGLGSECAEWTWGALHPPAARTAAWDSARAPGAQTQRIRCRVPCNWKKEFGGELGCPRRVGGAPSFTGPSQAAQL